MLPIYLIHKKINITYNSRNVSMKNYPEKSTEPYFITLNHVSTLSSQLRNALLRTSRSKIFTRLLIFKHRPHVCDTMQYHLQSIIMKRVASLSEPIRTATKIHMLNIPSGLKWLLKKILSAFTLSDVDCQGWLDMSPKSFLLLRKPPKNSHTNFLITSLRWEASNVNVLVLLICSYFIYFVSLYDL